MLLDLPGLIYPFSSMNDPSSIQAPPPRYLLESDSSDEEGQGAYPSSSRRLRQGTTKQIVSIHLDDYAGDVESLVVGVGQAGRYLARLLRANNVIGQVTTNDDIVGKAYRVEEGILMVMEECERPEGVFEVADEMLQSIKPRSW